MSRWTQWVMVASVLGLSACVGDVGPEPRFFGSEAALEVVSVRMTGTIDGRAIDETSYLDATGTRVGDDASFHVVRANSGSLDISACPLGEGGTQIDPYGGGGGGRGEPMGFPGGNGEVPTVDCFSRGLNVCDESSCARFSSEEVSLEVRDLGPRRALDLDAHGERGDLHVELRFYER